jgi:hypothetical protein
MSSRSSGPSPRTVPIALSLMALAFVLAVICAATAHAAYYKTLYCGAADGSGGPTLGARPGFFDFTDDCGTAYGDPAGTGGFLRLEENTTGTAGNTDEASYSWWAPPGISIAAVSAYTREPGYFNDGWRARFMGEGFDGSQNNILMQGYGVSSEGLYASSTGDFAYHAWPFGGFGDYKRLVFAMTCYRPAGCSREGWNAADTNSIAITLDDKEDPHVNWEGDSHVLAGDWVKGNNPIEWRESDVGSGLRLSRLRIDGADLPEGTIDYQANGGCRTGHSDANGEFARDFQPCTPGPYVRYYGLETTSLADGQHGISICVQDFSQYQHIGGPATETCDTRTIHTDNTAPGKPAELKVTSSNPARYLDHFGAAFSLPPDPGSPIAKVHYEVLDSTGKVVEPEKTVSATNPTSLANIEGPKAPGAYRLRVWLEDSVGFTGPAAEAPVPHDTTPPAAPQGLRVAGSDTHWLEKLDLRWQDLADEGSPVDEAHYQLIDASGNVLGGAHVLSGEGVQAIDGLDAPTQRCACEVRVWLTDEEGNTGAPASVALPRDTTPPAAPQDLSVSSPATSRATDGFDVHWRDIADDGSAINAAHYEVLNGAGKAAVPATTVNGMGIQAIADLQTPHDRGAYTLRLWLSDEEGNVGAPVSVPLSYDCVRSDSGEATGLSADLGDESSTEQRVRQGEGSTLEGRLRGPAGALSGAPVCVFSSVLTETNPEFLGIAMTGADGGYRFTLAPGPSRAIESIYRPGQRELSASATLYTRVHPALRVARRVVHNKHLAHFYVQIPGPDSDQVVVVLQAKQGKGWRTFRRCRTREDGRCQLVYRFGRTSSPATYVMRAQVRRQAAYPYLPGNSDPLRLRVLP